MPEKTNVKYYTKILCVLCEKLCDLCGKQICGQTALHRFRAGVQGLMNRLKNKLEKQAGSLFYFGSG